MPHISLSTALFIGRLLLAAMFAESVYGHLSHYSEVLAESQNKGLPMADWLLPASLLAESIGIMALLSGRYLRIGSLLLMAFVVSSTVIFFPFWTLSGPEGAVALQQFVKNFALVGFLVVIYASEKGAQRRWM